MSLGIAVTQLVAENDALRAQVAALTELVQVAHRKIVKDEDFGWCLWCDPGGHGDHQMSCPALPYLAKQEGDG